MAKYADNSHSDDAAKSQGDVSEVLNESCVADCDS